MKLYRTIALLSFLSFGLTGCFDIFMKNGAYTVSESKDDSLQIFRETVGERIQSNNCTACHQSTQVPFIASQNLSLAYSEARAKVSFEDPASSKIIAKATDGHCSPQCHSSSADTWVTAITQWRDREANSGSGGGGEGTGGGGGGGGTGGGGGGNQDFNLVTYLLREVNIPDVLNPNPMPVSLDLVTDRVMGTGNFSGVKLLFDIDTVVNLPNTYRIKNLRVNNTTAQPVSISGMYVRLNGVYDSSWGALYSGVSKVINGNQTTTLSTSVMLIPKNVGGANRIQIGFVSVSSFVCNQLSDFAASVKPILKSTNPNRCLNCHGGGNGGATSKYDMRSNVDADLCRIFMSKTDRANPANSITITYPRFGSGGHTNLSGVFSAQDAMNFQTFIQQEWATH